MAQDPGQDREEDQVDTSHDLDMVSIYHSETVDAEIEADVIRGLLDSNGIAAVVVGSAQLPVVGFEVQVARSQAEEAQQLIAEAEDGGPEAAAEAEAASEEGQENG
jgi:hypothetical protein